AMGAYTRRFRYQHPVPKDLIETFQREMGNEAGELLRDALFDKGWIDLKIEAMSSHMVHAPAGIFDKDGKRATTPPPTYQAAGKFEGWVLVVRRGTLHLPVDVELIAAD